MNRKLLILVGPVAGIVMFVAVVWIATLFVSHNEYRDAYRAPAATADTTPRAEGVAAEQAAAETKAKATPYVEAEYPDVPRCREPRGDLGRRAAPSAVRGLRACRPNLRVHRRGDWLQDRGSAIRPARARVHEAALGLLLAHRDLRRVPDVHADRAVPEVHELPDERVLPDVSPVRPALLRSKPSSSTPTTTAGGSSIPWCILAWGSASTSWARRSCSSPMPGSRS